MSNNPKKLKNYVGPYFMQDWFRPTFWWLFTASAETHDRNYAKGGTKQERLEADLGFLHRILKDANRIRNYSNKRKAVRYAILYYILVRLYGWALWKNK